jgi:hypothetical protein
VTQAQAWRRGLGLRRVGLGRRGQRPGGTGLESYHDGCRARKQLQVNVTMISDSESDSASHSPSRTARAAPGRPGPGGAAAAAAVTVTSHLEPWSRRPSDDLDDRDIRALESGPGPAGWPAGAAPPVRYSSHRSESKLSHSLPGPPARWHWHRGLPGIDGPGPGPATLSLSLLIISESLN